MPASLIRIEQPPLDRTTVERLGLERGEPDWLIEARREAVERYTATPWPRTNVGEEWRRFPLGEVPLEELERPAGGLSALSGPHETGVLRMSLDAAAREHPELVRPNLLGEGGAASHAAIRAYAHARWESGTFVRIPAGTSVARPIEVVTGTGVSRTLVVAEAGSRATVVEELIAPEGWPRLALPILDLFLQEGAAVDYVRIQRLDQDVWDLGSQYYRSERDSRLASFNLIVGSARSKVGLGSDIVGAGAVVKLYGLVAVGDDQKIDLNTFQDLAGSHSESVLLYLAALYDRAKAVTYGVIRVEPQSRGTSSYQEFRNLLLSEHAGADPIPVLEILTNDVVRCGHGATVGAIDPAELFYVMSRGLPRDDAERLIVRGFFERVVANVSDSGVQRRMLEALRPRIGTVAELEEAV